MPRGPPSARYPHPSVAPSRNLRRPDRSAALCPRGLRPHRRRSPPSHTAARPGMPEGATASRNAPRSNPAPRLRRRRSRTRTTARPTRGRESVSCRTHPSGRCAAAARPAAQRTAGPRGLRRRRGRADARPETAWPPARYGGSNADVPSSGLSSCSSAPRFCIPRSSAAFSGRNGHRPGKRNQPRCGLATHPTTGRFRRLYRVMRSRGFEGIIRSRIFLGGGWQRGNR